MPCWGAIFDVAFPLNGTTCSLSCELAVNCFTVLIYRAQAARWLPALNAGAPFLACALTATFLLPVMPHEAPVELLCIALIHLDIIVAGCKHIRRDEC